MLIVTGSVRARPEHIARLLEPGIDHVHRSRQAAGRLVHSVHRDAEDESRLVFLEHWTDADALRAHFAVPASINFVREAAALSMTAPEMSIYAAEPTSVS